MKNEFDLISESRSVLAFAIRQSDTLRSKLAPIAAYVFDGGDLATMTDRLSVVFTACRGESIAAKNSGRKEHVRALGKAWNRLADGLRYHASQHELVLGFPNLASGAGTLRVERSPEAAIRRKAEKAAREEADAAALAAFQADQAQQQLDALRSMTPAQLAESIATQLAAWSDDPSQHRAVFSALAELIPGACVMT